MKLSYTSSLAALVLCASASAQHPLAPFGYESMKNTSGQLAKGPGFTPKTQKCLVILIDTNKMAGDFDEGRGNAYYDNLIFNASAVRNNTQTATPSGSVNGFLLENSKGDFQLIPAVGNAHPNGVIGPYVTSVAEADSILPNLRSGNEKIMGEIALDVACRNGFILKDHDTDGNGNVTDSELNLIVVETTPRPLPLHPTDPTKDGPLVESSGMNRGLTAYTPNGQPPNQVASFTGSFVSVLEKVDFATLVHEVTHTYGTDDIYAFNRHYPGLSGSVNDNLTLMANTIANPFNPKIFHLDCWHKMALGWAEPQLVSMKAGGVYSLNAAQVGTAANAVLLYDPTRPAQGTGEYFMLEYRNSELNAATNYDGQFRATSHNGQLLKSGVLLWHIQMDPNFATSGHQRALNVTSTLVLEVADANGNMVLNNSLNGVWTEGPPYGNGDIGVDRAWTGGLTSFYLRWNDGSTSKCRFRVRPFLPTDQSVTVEILSEYDTWVDFAHIGAENGAFNTPYNTMYEGAINVGWGGKLKCKGPRSGTLSIILDKPMTITAEGGPVTITEP